MKQEDLDCSQDVELDSGHDHDTPAVVEEADYEELCQYLLAHGKDLGATGADPAEQPKKWSHVGNTKI